MQSRVDQLESAKKVYQVVYDNFNQPLGIPCSMQEFKSAGMNTKLVSINLNQPKGTPSSIDQFESARRGIK